MDFRDSILAFFRNLHTSEAKFVLLTNCITYLLKSALKTETTKAEPLTGEQPDEQDTKPDNGIETTQEETEAYLIVKSILRQKIDPQSIHSRDVQSCAILITTRSPYTGSISTRRSKYKVKWERLNY